MFALECVLGGKQIELFVKGFGRKLNPQFQYWPWPIFIQIRQHFRKKFVFCLYLKTEICPITAKRQKNRNFDNFCKFLNACLKPLFMVKNLSVWSATLTVDWYHVSSDPEICFNWPRTYIRHSQYQDVMLLTFTSKVWGCFFMPYEA